MPERNERRVVLGMKKAEREYDRYIRERVIAERSAADLARQLEESARFWKRKNREAKPRG